MGPVGVVAGEKTSPNKHQNLILRMGSDGAEQFTLSRLLLRSISSECIKHKAVLNPLVETFLKPKPLLALAIAFFRAWRFIVPRVSAIECKSATVGMRIHSAML